MVGLVRKLLQEGCSRGLAEWLFRRVGQTGWLGGQAGRVGWDGWLGWLVRTVGEDGWYEALVRRVD